MKKSKIATIIDRLFLSTALSLLFFIWIRKVIESLIISIAVSIIIGFAISKILQLFLKSRTTKKELSQQEIEKTKKILLYFRNLTKSEILIFFKQMFETKYRCEICSNYVKILKSANSNDKNCNIAIFCEYFCDICDLEKLKDAEKISKKLKAKMYFFSTNFSTSSIQFANSNENIYIFSASELLFILKKFNFVPNIEETKIQKRDFKKILYSFFQKEKSKNYFFASLFLFFGSFFLPYSLYYKIFASLLLIFSIISFFSKSKKQELFFEL